MSTQNREVLESIGRAVTTDDLSGQGGLTVEQVKAFITAFQDAEPLSALVEWKMAGAKSGKLPRLGFGTRLLRGKSEMVGPANLQDPVPTSVDYALESVRLDWEIPDDVLEFNVEGADYYVTVFNGMSNAFGLDLLDLGLNGDKATDPSDPDYRFLKVLNGWLIKLTTGGGNILDAAGLPGGAAIDKSIFFAAKRMIPAKWKTRLNRYRWILHPDLVTSYMEALSNGVGTAADQALIDGRTSKIVGIEYLECSKMPVDKILLADPKQMAMVYRRNMKLNSVNSSTDKECAAEGKSYSVLHGDYDPIWYWADSAVEVTNVTGA